MARTPGHVVIEEVEHFRAFGDKPAAIATQLGMTPQAIARALYRANRPDLANHFERECTRTHPCIDCGAPVANPRAARCRPHGHAQRMKTRYGTTTTQEQS